MRGPSFRVRTLMAAVAVVAFVIWASMMGSRSYVAHGQAGVYAEQEQGWREIAARKRRDSAFASECAEYFGRLTRKYRRATWHPWLRIEPDPWAPGAEAAYRSNLATTHPEEAIPVTIPPMPRPDPIRIDPAHQNAPTKNEK